MNLYIGTDLGTSSAKLLLADETGVILNTVTKEYPLEFPAPGWSQQAPEDWKRAVWEGVPELLKGFDASAVAGIGVGGQMHGLVVLDENDNVIRPAILQRGDGECVALRRQGIGGAGKGVVHGGRRGGDGRGARCDHRQYPRGYPLHGDRG